MTRLYGADGLDLDCVTDLLLSGQLVALPTETVYGLAGDALREDVVRQIFDVKMRPFIDPLIVHIAELRQGKILAEISPEVELLAGKYWPGPLTMVLRKRPVVPDLVTAGLPTVAIRMPAHQVMRQVLQKSGLCLAAPSANPFGYVSPTRAQHVIDSLSGRVAHVVDGGDCQHGIESTVIGLQDPDRPVLLRPGPIGREQLEATLDREVRRATAHLDKQAQVSPGLLKKHYSPAVDVDLLPHGFSDLPTEITSGQAMVFFQRPKHITGDEDYDLFWLTEDGDPTVAAQNLFALLRKLDSGSRYSRLWIEQAPSEGLGSAINDRLKRAAVK